MKKVLRSEQHPYYNDWVIVYFEDGTKGVYPKIEYVNLPVTVISKYYYQGKEVKLVSDFGF